MKDTAFFAGDSCDLDAFRDLCAQRLDPSDLAHAAGVVKNVPIYECRALGTALAEPETRALVLAEWAQVLGTGSGVLALRGAYADTALLDEATALYERIIADEKAASGGGADHFAKAGANDRVWNSAQKLCLADPDLFVRYFGNPVIDAVCEAWLGPGYQVTAQVNLVRPGGAAQEAHRDYHLGFQTEEVARQFPAHAHALSATLTLQGAVAHCDMPVEAGPTKLLPFSQTYGPGYLAYRRPEFRAFFEEAHVQVPLEKGDAVFFNPALFHAGGANRTEDVQRFANLLQVSSAFGRAMESLDRTAMVKAIYPVLREGGFAPVVTRAAIAAAAEGYSFPTNLDTDPPVGGLAPETQAALCARALEEGLTPDAFSQRLDEQDTRRRP